MSKLFASDNLSPKWYAQRIIHDYSISSAPVDVKSLVQKMKIRYVEDDLGPVDCDGTLLQKGTKVLIIINTSVVYQSRRNFTLAHELGHYVIEHHNSENYSCSKLDMETYDLSSRKQEAEANIFAAELLMPEQLFLKIASSKSFTFKSIEEIAEIFQVSLSAAAIRYIEFAEDPAAIFLSQDRKIKWGCKSKALKYELKRGTLSDTSYAIDAFISSDELPVGFEQVYSHTWFADSDISDTLNVLEHSIHLKNANIVLSLIKIKMSSEEAEDYWEE